jgi:FixJ family two-component response regulator
MTVHIVEDDHGVRDALSELCRSVGRPVQVYPDSESFRSRAAVTPQDLVLVDLGLPDEPGTEILKRMTALPTPPKMIVISGLSLSEISKAMAGFAGIAVMRKPLTGDLITMLM